MFGLAKKCLRAAAAAATAVAAAATVVVAAAAAAVGVVVGATAAVVTTVWVAVREMARGRVANAARTARYVPYAAAYGAAYGGLTAAVGVGEGWQYYMGV
jgi:hypothetical protein